jgi:hypothetical protein
LKTSYAFSPVAENIAANRPQTQILAANINFGQIGWCRAIF